jgi:hypothetical protein
MCGVYEWTAKWWKAFNYQGWRRKLGPVFHVPGRIVEFDNTTTSRAFKIARSKATLFGIINWLQPATAEVTTSPMVSRQMRMSQNNMMALSELTNIARQKMDVVDQSAFKVMIDGEHDAREGICRVNSNGLFDLYGIKCASDGFWLFLKPNSLEKGRHLISTFGVCSSGQTRLAMDYEITVV